MHVSTATGTTAPSASTGTACRRPHGGGDAQSIWEPRVEAFLYFDHWEKLYAKPYHWGPPSRGGRAGAASNVSVGRRAIDARCLPRPARATTSGAARRVSRPLPSVR